MPGATEPLVGICGAATDNADVLAGAVGPFIGASLLGIAARACSLRPMFRHTSWKFVPCILDCQHTRSGSSSHFKDSPTIGDTAKDAQLPRPLETSRIRRRQWPGLNWVLWEEAVTEQVQPKFEKTYLSTSDSKDRPAVDLSTLSAGVQHFPSTLIVVE
jgi:hypothetical protein